MGCDGASETYARYQTGVRTRACGFYLGNTTSAISAVLGILR